LTRPTNLTIQKKSLKPITRTDVYKALLTVDDPELGADIVNLGLIYDISLVDSIWCVTMTLTYPGCPLVDVFREQISHALTKLVGLKKFELKFSFSPPWTPEMMDPDLRVALSL
jgi:metal-sulfur cluster biosynthetic enzyme